MQRKIHGQMSESFLIAGILSISSILLRIIWSVLGKDVLESRIGLYDYQGKVFANADRQYRLCWHRIWYKDRNWQAVLRYFLLITVLRIGSGNGMGRSGHPYEIPEGTEDPLETTVCRNTLRISVFVVLF